MAAKIGAVNTLVFESDGSVAGYNTDYAGALDALTGTLGTTRANLAGMTTAIIGAGGVARAVVAGLTSLGARVTVYNRTVEKAAQLAGEYDCESAPLGQLESLDAQLVINCTSIGMHPAVEASPMPARCISGDMIVFDTVYNPVETLLLRQARAAGAQTVDGVSMFVNQAAIQFKLFTGVEPPRELMQEVIARHLQ